MDFKTHKVSRNIRMLVPLMNVLLLNSRTGKWDIWHQCLKDKFRYLTPVEMCRLQTLPDDYLDGIAPNTAMSLTGNGWTVDVIAHLLKGIECR